MEARGNDEGIHPKSRILLLLLLLLLCYLIVFILKLLLLCFSFVCLGLQCSRVKNNVLVVLIQSFSTISFIY